MSIKFSILMTFGLSLIACVPSQQSLPPQRAQEVLAQVWQADAHITWEIDWPDAPTSGPLTVETWRAGDRYRLEILEAVAPALRGETLVFDGQNAWRYNRFQPPTVFEPVSPILSPVSDAFNVVDRLLQISPNLAVQEPAYLNGISAQKVELTFVNTGWLRLWWDRQTGLPLQVIFSVQGQQVKLQARQAEPLVNPPDELFGVGDWINNLR